MEFLVLKLLHILAVVIFLGNITLGLFWKAHADKTKNPDIITHTLQGIIRSDRIFTIPSVLLIVIFGFSAAITGGYPILRTGWIFWAIVLFTISGISFMMKVVPLQRQLLEVAESGQKGGKLDWTLYEKLSKEWELYGGIALLAPLLAAAMMVLKPALPSI
ncbi:DUF2269 family protein [Candidatus Acetothermia bacterium]|nr:DUF2269 family protein [Candidatus Acetothermia bacterium]